jgi:[acyl-carrier-protein] S-malonyltransferase
MVSLIAHDSFALSINLVIKIFNSIHIRVFNMQNKLAFVFPGQGSQSVAMLSDFLGNNIVEKTFTEASEALGYDLWQLVAEGPVEKLNQTNFTQPALLTASVALWRVWLSTSEVKPDVMAGHSLGEYSALVCAGVISLSDAVKLVEKRGELMQACVPAGIGAMAAVIGLADQEIINACELAQQAEVVSAVNFNSPGQVVIAGHKAAVERAGQLCKDAGAKRVLPLPVSVPSHCALMADAATELAKEKTGEAIKVALIKQLYSPVRWSETIKQIVSEGITTVIEVGPGKVLQGLNKRIDKSISSVSMNSPDTVQKVQDLTNG